MKKKAIAALAVAGIIGITACMSGCIRSLPGSSDWFYSSDNNTSVNGTDSAGSTADETGDSNNKNESTGAQSTTKPKEVTTIKQNTSKNGEALTVSEIYSNNVSSVVGITTKGKTTNIFGQQSATASTGTGIVITENGYIATNYHVIEGGDSFQVAFYDGTVYDAELVGYESSNDVAVLKVEASGLNAAELGNSDEIVVGEDIVVIGNPLGELTYTLTRGVVSALNRAINTDGTPINMFQIDAAVNAGNSGGPAFDALGNVVGMVTAKYASESIEGLGFCIPINDVVKIAGELINYGYVRGKAALEIGVQDAYSRSFWGTTRISGAYVSYIIPGGCADKAGLQEGSIINYVNNTAITGADDLSTVMRSFNKGETVTITGYYNNKAFELKVTLSEYTPSIVPDGWSSSDGTVV